MPKKQGLLLAIDPGNLRSAYVIIDSQNYVPLRFAKISNDELLHHIEHWDSSPVMNGVAQAAIETMIGSYGQIGRTTIDTAIMIGRLEQALLSLVPVALLARQDIKKHLCPGIRSNDRTIRSALIARFTKEDLRTGKGTRKNPDMFFGFAADVWSAYAVGVTWLDLERTSAPLD